MQWTGKSGITRIKGCHFVVLKIKNCGASKTDVGWSIPGSFVTGGWKKTKATKSKSIY
jgi:hypothetical protein